MRSRAVLGVFIVVAVVAVTMPGLALAQPESSTGPAQTTEAASAGTNTTIRIQPRPDGDARFRVSTAFALDDRNDTEAFRALARDFEDENGNAGFSVTPFRRATSEAAVATGRPMNVTNVTRNATIEGENRSGADVGRLALGFTWTNFTRRSGDRLFVGDVFRTTQGTWLPGLTASQRLVVESPRGYRILSAPIGPENGTLRWNGPTSFDPGSPSVTFEQLPSSGQSGPSGNDGGPFASTPLFALGAGVVVLGVGIIGLYAWTQRGSGTSANRDDEPREEAVTTGEETTGPEAEIETGADDEAIPATELLSDEERVERLLERNDGRMKQATIVAETGWSNAKVSQLLSAMDEADRVDKLRIGRENLISLPEERDE